MVFRRKNNDFDQTSSEEMWNTITHGLGLVLSVVAFGFLLKGALAKGTGLHLASFSIYGSSLVCLYLCSTLYHAVTSRAKKLFRLLDHLSIYFLIFGTYAPIGLIAIYGPVGITIFSIELVLLLAGVTFKIVFAYRYPVLSALFYLLMGWLAVFAIGPIIENLPFYGGVWLFTGGLFYTLGVIFFALDQRYHYFHSIWHVFVLLGSFSHFYLIFRYVL